MHRRANNPNVINPGVSWAFNTSIGFSFEVDRLERFVVVEERGVELLEFNVDDDVDAERSGYTFRAVETRELAIELESLANGVALEIRVAFEIGEPLEMDGVALEMDGVDGGRVIDDESRVNLVFVASLFMICLGGNRDDVDIDVDFKDEVAFFKGPGSFEVLIPLNINLQFIKMNSLPTELFDLIFSYLDLKTALKCAQSCRKWSRQDPIRSLVELEISLGPLAHSKTIPELFPCLKRLYIGPRASPTLTGHPRLQELTVHLSRTSNLVDGMFDCVLLKKLDVHLYSPGDLIQIQGVVSVLPNLSNLRVSCAPESRADIPLIRTLLHDRLPSFVGPVSLTHLYLDLRWIEHAHKVCNFLNGPSLSDIELVLPPHSRVFSFDVWFPNARPRSLKISGTTRRYVSITQMPDSLVSFSLCAGTILTQHQGKLKLSSVLSQLPILERVDFQGIKSEYDLESQCQLTVFHCDRFSGVFIPKWFPCLVELSLNMDGNDVGIVLAQLSVSTPLLSKLEFVGGSTVMDLSGYFLPRLGHFACKSTNGSFTRFIIRHSTLKFVSTDVSNLVEVALPSDCILCSLTGLYTNSTLPCVPKDAFRFTGLYSLLKSSPHLKELSLGGRGFERNEIDFWVPHADPLDYPTLPSYFPRLANLQITDCISAQSLWAWSRSGEWRETLTDARLYLSSQSASVKALLLFIETHRRLKYLKVVFCRGMAKSELKGPYCLPLLYPGQDSRVFEDVELDKVVYQVQETLLDVQVPSSAVFSLVKEFLPHVNGLALFVTVSKQK